MHEIHTILEIKEPDNKHCCNYTEVAAAGEPAGSGYLTQFSMGNFSVMFLSREVLLPLILFLLLNGF